MNSRADICGLRDDRTAINNLADGSGGMDRDNGTGRELDAVPLHRGRTLVTSQVAADLTRIPESVLASVSSKPGEYDARRLRSQREIIRDVMISAADCETWLTLGELRALTRYGEASISAQLRHLRKTENGGYDVIKRHREGATPERPGTDGRGECIWEYRITRGMCGIGTGRTSSGGLDAVA
jgi:hypothetical protein